MEHRRITGPSPRSRRRWASILLGAAGVGLLAGLLFVPVARAQWDQDWDQDQGPGWDYDYRGYTGPYGFYDYGYYDPYGHYDYGYYDPYTNSYDYGYYDPYDNRYYWGDTPEYRYYTDDWYDDDGDFNAWNDDYDMWD